MTQNFRLHAIAALGHIHAEAQLVVPVLTKALSGQNQSVRLIAAFALGQFGPAAKSAVPALSKLLGDQDPNLRAITVDAIKKIDSETAALRRAELGGESEKQQTAALTAQAEHETRSKAPVAAHDGLDVLEGRATTACISNLRQIDGAKQQWAFENKKTATDIPTWDDLKPFLGKESQVLSCPADGIYSMNVLTAAPTCSVPGHMLQR